MNEVEKIFFSPFLSQFYCVFVCTRVWSAWSYNTMTKDDFVMLTETEFTNDFFIFIEDNNFKIDIQQLINFLENYEAYYNQLFYVNFEKEHFDQDWISNFDIESLYQSLNDGFLLLQQYKISNELKGF